MHSQEVQYQPPTASAAKVTPLTCSGHTRPVMHLHFSPMLVDKSYLFISACKDGNPMLRDGKTGDWIGTFLGHKGAVWSARLSKDAEKAVTGSADFLAKVWDTYTGAVLQSFTHGHIVRSVDFNSTATMIATGGHEKILRIFDIRSSQVATEFPDSHQGTIKSVVWDHRPGASDYIIITAADDRKLRYWDIRAEKELFTWTTPTNELFTSLEQSPTYLTATAGKTVYFINPQTYAVERKITTAYDVSSVSLNVTKTKFVTGGSSELWVRVYDFDSGREMEVYKGHHGPIHTVSFSPDGGLYATGSEDGTIRLWKSETGPYGLWK